MVLSRHGCMGLHLLLRTSHSGKRAQKSSRCVWHYRSSSMVTRLLARDSMSWYVPGKVAAGLSSHKWVEVLASVGKAGALVSEQVGMQEASIRPGHKFRSSISFDCARKRPVHPLVLYKAFHRSNRRWEWGQEVPVLVWLA